MLKKQKLIEVALGEKKADLVIKNAKLVNVLTEEIYDAEVASALADYKREREAYKKAIQTDTPNSILIGYKKQLARNYDIYLDKLQAAIKEYQEAYGLS